MKKNKNATANRFEVVIVQEAQGGGKSPYALEVRNMDIRYDDFLAVKDVTMAFDKRRVTAIIGPSGCGKSTALRAFNRMNELIPTCATSGEVLFHGINIYDPEVDAVQVRRWIGMVFQKPNPFPKTIYENIAWGARINGYTGDMDELVETQPPAGGSLGRSEGQAKAERPGPFGRPAAAPLHSPGDLP